MFDTLEPRRLMSATHNVEANVVTVSGTDADDLVTIARRRGELTVSLNGQPFAFDASRVQRVEVFGGAGDDRINGTRSDLPLVANGEDGDDRILSGAGADTLSGGAGADLILGRAGDDTFAGDDGDDAIHGGAGNDAFVDTAGEDLLAGNAGNDTFEDRDGRGAASGGAGVDTATVFAERYRTVGVENINFAPGAVNPAADPQFHLYATRAADGVVRVFVEATHLESGFEKEFGPARRIGTRFQASVAGVDVAPDPAAPRTPVVDVDTQPYELGRLAPGVYRFDVLSPRGDAVRATLTFGVTATGLTPETPAAPGPSGPGTVLPPKRVRGSVTGPGLGGGNGGGGGGVLDQPSPDELLDQMRPEPPARRTGPGFTPRMGVSPVAAPGMR